MGKIELPKILDHLEKEIKIESLMDAIKFEFLMELYNNHTLEEIERKMKD